MAEEIRTLQDADQLAEAIREKYQTYTSHMQTLERKTTMLDTLKGWVMGGSVASRDDANKTFYGEVETLTVQLHDALAELETAEAARCCALAAEVILSPRPVKSKKASDWMLLAAEGLAIPLLPFLDRETLDRLCRQYQMSCPKRMMLPKQKEVLLAMQRQLGC